METRSTILLIAITAGSCVLATAEQCNDYGLRPDPTVSNPLIWEFYNFTNLGERRGCFLCVEITADSSRFSRLILPCEPSAISFTLSDFSYNEDDMSIRSAIGVSNNAIDCQTAYNSAPVDGFDTRTPKEINLEEERINDHSSNTTYMPTRLYRIATRSYSITQTVCIRNLTYTYPSTTSSTGITPVSSGKPTTVITAARTTSVTEEMFTTSTAALPVSTRPALTTVVSPRNPLRTTPDLPAAYPVSNQPAGTTVVSLRSPLRTTLSGTSSPSSEVPPWIWIVAFLIIVIVVAAFAGGVILGRRGSFLGAPQTSSNSKTAPEFDTTSIAVAQVHVTSDASYEDVRNNTAYEVPNAPMKSSRGKLTPGSQTDGARRADVGQHPPDESYEGIRYSDGYETPTNITTREDRVYYVNKGIVGVTNK